MKKNILLLALLLSVFSCSQHTNNENYRVINMHDLTEKKLDKHIDEIFKNKKYIVLDDSKGEYPAEIVKILYRNSKIFILSEQRISEKLLAFDASGDFLFKVGYEGRAKNEYLDISDFDVSDNGEIFINDVVAGKILKYDAEGQFMEVIDPAYKDIYSLKHLSEDNFLFGLADWTVTDPKIESVKIFNGESTVYSHYGNYLDYNIIISQANFTVAGNNVFFSNNLSDTVSNFTTNGDLIEKLYFDFGNRAVPNEDKVNLEQKMVTQRIYEKYTLLMNFCCVDGNYIYGGLFDGMVVKNFVLDQKNQTIYKLDKDNQSSVGNIVGFDKKYLISHLDFVAYEENPNAFDENISNALKENKTVICLYSK